MRAVAASAMGRPLDQFVPDGLRLYPQCDKQVKGCEKNEKAIHPNPQHI